MDRLCLATFFLVAVVSSGCGSSERPGSVPPPAAKVSGTVTMDKKPVPTGEIHFGVGGFPPSVLEIKDGKYEGEAPIGKNEVQVFIYIEGPPVAKYDGMRLKTNTTPSRYWGAETTLSATVEEGGANQFDFSLSSK